MNQSAVPRSIRPACIIRALPASASACTLATPAFIATSLDTVRFSTFNASMNRNTETQLESALAEAADAQIRRVVEVIETVRPEVLLKLHVAAQPPQSRIRCQRHAAALLNAAVVG